MTASEVTAVVLAGGRSSRFGRDKLAEQLDGRSLLDRAIAGVRPHAGAVIVVARPGGDPTVPADVLVVRDPVAFQGPLAGLLAGLKAATGPVVLVVGGDMPELIGAVAAAMLAALAVPGVAAVVLEDQGRARPLPVVLRRAPATAAAARLRSAGEHRLRALIDALATEVIAEADWRALDPDGRSVRDIDTPADLVDPRDD